PPSSSTFRFGFEPHPSDIFTAVMGMTGSGKSLFISQCTDEAVTVGHDLQACMFRASGVSFSLQIPQYNSQHTYVYLVDTPGFDDTNRSDTEVLKDIAAWLNESYKEKVILRGILHLYRITDPRTQGSARRNLCMSKKLCGPEALKNVLLVTPPFQFTGVSNASSGRTGAACSGRERPLELQVDMVDIRLALSDTKAGQEIERAIAKAKQKFQKEISDLKKQMKEALVGRDKEAAQVLQEQ
ncbi:hypothetical protein QBC46DRAFT_255873, partial [Diplogelasinospora grovesii]